MADIRDLKNLQLGVGQFPPQPCIPFSERVSGTVRCQLNIVDSQGNELLNVVCAEEFFARALSRDARSLNFTVGTSPVPINLPRRYNRCIILNDSTTGSLAVSFSPGGNPGGFTAAAISVNSIFEDSQIILPEESRTFEIWSDTITIVGSEADVAARVTLYFP